MAENADFDINIKVKGEQDVDNLAKKINKLNSAMKEISDRTEAGDSRISNFTEYKFLEKERNKAINLLEKQRKAQEKKKREDEDAILTRYKMETNIRKQFMSETAESERDHQNLIKETAAIINGALKSRQEQEKRLKDYWKERQRNAEDEYKTAQRTLSQQRTSVGVVESMMRRYRWFQSLILVTLNFLRVLGGQSKVLDSMMGMIGTGIGYILNMIMIPLLPLAILILQALIGIGKVIHWLNNIITIPFTNLKVPIGTIISLLLLAKLSFWGLGKYVPGVAADIATAWAKMTANMSSNWLIFKKLFDFSALSMGWLFLGVVAGLAIGWLALGELLKQDLFKDVLRGVSEFGAAFGYVIQYLGEAFQRLGSYIFEGKFLTGHDIKGELGGLLQGYHNAFQAQKSVREARFDAQFLPGVQAFAPYGFSDVLSAQLPYARAGAYDTVPEFEQYTFNIDEIKVEGVKDADEFMREFEPEFEKMLERVNARNQIGSGTY